MLIFQLKRLVPVLFIITLHRVAAIRTYTKDDLVKLR